ncbi:hypothetical protein IV203_034697 [Nitzschia inconspicua]|uniref:Uncharacterized protein n=1 Tax=Nitzschia inconspicua TaxID=303405 RepID=A0A9K3LC77_9STRA|nr:hypothetical protein IV203_034697 [Nitzschia inconspicua]
MQSLDEEATKRTTTNAAATASSSPSSNLGTPSDRLSPYISIQDDDATKQQVEEDEDDDDSINVVEDINVGIDDDDLDQKLRARRPFPQARSDVSLLEQDQAIVNDIVPHETIDL